MQTLKRMLQETEEALLDLLGKRWGVDARGMSRSDQIDAINTAMLDPEHLESVFDSLSDGERGALQALVSSGRKMAVQMFEMFYGPVRLPSAGIIERDRPHEKPQGVAESLLYRGLIGRGPDKTNVGVGYVMYIPEDLAAALPLHKTGYNAAVLEAEAPRSTAERDPMPPVNLQVEPLEAEQISDVRPADTSIVDDMTTVLAYLQVHTAAFDVHQGVDDTTFEALLQHLLWQDAARLTFMIEIGITANMIEIQNGRLYPRRAEARAWLEEPRTAQLKFLVDAWLRSTEFRELWHTPGLLVEEAATYDPTAARRALLDVMREEIPRGEWWSMDDFIDVMHVRNPGFQRPGADFDGWYIRNDEDEYLNGFESWNAVEGAVLEFYLTGPLHWLGLLDLAEFAAKLSAFGRALLDNRWIQQQDSFESISIQPDGEIIATRKTSRYERFQLARFTSWQSPATREGGPYVYQLDGVGIRRGAEQGINTEAIAKFLSRVSAEDSPLPPAITRMLETWRSGPAASVTLEQQIILRTTSKEVLDAIWDSPPLRRFFGARLGDSAVIVRGDQWQALMEALGAGGIDVESHLD